MQLALRPVFTNMVAIGFSAGSINFLNVASSIENQNLWDCTGIYLIFKVPISRMKFSSPVSGTVILAFVFSGYAKFGNEILEAS